MSINNRRPRRPTIETLSEAIEAMTSSNNIAKINMAETFLLGSKGLSSSNPWVRTDTLMAIDRLSWKSSHFKKRVHDFKKDPKNGEVVLMASKRRPIHSPA